jgi:hypothetical protein
MVLTEARRVAYARSMSLGKKVLPYSGYGLRGVRKIQHDGFQREPVPIEGKSCTEHDDKAEHTVGKPSSSTYKV